MNTNLQHPDIIPKLDFQVDSNQVIHGTNGSYYLRYKLWHVFLMLINHHGQVVSRNTLIDKVWDGNYYTGPKGLTHSICKLRTIAKEIGLPLTIETCYKSGYQLKLHRTIELGKSTKSDEYDTSFSKHFEPNSYSFSMNWH